MANLINFRTEDGRTVLISVKEETLQQGRVPAGLATTAAETASRSLEASLDAIRPFVSLATSKLKESVGEADEISVEFGVGFSAKAGTFIASLDSEATLKVRATWKRSK